MEPLRAVSSAATSVATWRGVRPSLQVIPVAPARARRRAHAASGPRTTERALRRRASQTAARAIATAPAQAAGAELSVGVAEVDRQHKTLIEILNALHDGKNQGRGSDMLKATLARLATYTVEHFAYEERILTQYGYPELPGHVESHEKLKARVIEFKTAFDEGRSSLGIELFMFLRSWLNGHIRGSDRAYGKFLNAKGIR